MVTVAIILYEQHVNHHGGWKGLFVDVEWFFHLSTACRDPVTLSKPHVFSWPSGHLGCFSPQFEMFFRSLQVLQLADSLAAWWRRQAG